jgi:hypothetical protein
MIYSVVGCGESAKEWFNTFCDVSIGVNDCFKFGHQVDYLLCVNAPFKFLPTKANNYTDRLSTIRKSNPQKFLTSLCYEWRKYRQDLQCMKIQRFGKHLNKESVYHTRSSTFIAMSWAYKQGAKDIILWGVDFLNHADFPVEQRATQFEIEEYRRFADMIEKEGTKVWIGNENTGLNKYFEVYDKS